MIPTQLNDMELQELKMRLDNLEKKMDEVVSAVNILPRIEERMINQKHDLTDHEQRLRKLEETVSTNSVYRTREKEHTSYVLLVTSLRTPQRDACW